MEGEGKFKLPSIQTKDKRKFIKVKGRKLFLDTLLKNINKKRKKEKKRQLKSITKRNLKNALAEFLFKKEAPRTGKTVQPKKIEFTKIKKPRRRRVPRIGKTKDPTRVAQQQKEIDSLNKKVSELKTRNDIQIIKNTINDIKSRSILKQGLLENKMEDIKQDAVMDEFRRIQMERNEPAISLIEQKMTKEEKERILKESGATLGEKGPLITEDIDPEEEKIIQTKAQEKYFRDLTEPMGEEFDPFAGEGKGHYPLKPKRGQDGGLMTEKDDALSNFDIDKMMNRYKDFKGTFPRDHLYKVMSEIKPQSRMGCILNLDEAKDSGSHWVSLLIDARPKGSHSIEYFDSFGRDIPKDILEDAKRIVRKMKPEQHMKLKINRRKMQDPKTVSCGYIASKFLMDRFRGKSFKKATGYGINKSEDNAEDMKQRFEYLFI